MTRRAIIADVASKTTKTADVVVVVVSRVPPPHLVAPVPLGRHDNAIASPVRWLLLTSAVMMAVGGRDVRYDDRRRLCGRHHRSQC